MLAVAAPTRPSVTADSEAREHTVTRADIEAMEDGEAKREAFEKWRQEKGIPVFDALSIAADQPSEVDDEEEQETAAEATCNVPESVRRDAKKYKEKFEEHAQFVFSHVQHHWHALQDGVRVPLPYCRKTCMKHGKGAAKKRRQGCMEICKQDFPKTRRLNLVPRVLCPGVALSLIHI